VRWHSMRIGGMLAPEPRWIYFSTNILSSEN